ncbi:MAG: S-layer homology domain-containing protein, partial [Clostridia bacterium]|nr:S-layer homology domain-containing protein [Clostridia bacterium]
GRASLDSFPDASAVHSYASDALSWANAAGYITGKEEKGNILLDPRGSATRAQVATILTRFDKNN